VDHGKRKEGGRKTQAGRARTRNDMNNGHLQGVRRHCLTKGPKEAWEGG